MRNYSTIPLRMSTELQANNLALSIIVLKDGKDALGLKLYAKSIS